MLQTAGFTEGRTIKTNGNRGRLDAQTVLVVVEKGERLYALAGA